MSYIPFKKDGQTLLPIDDPDLSDSDIDNSQWSIWLDESADEFNLKAKKSDGTVLIQSIGLGGISSRVLTENNSYSTVIDVSEGDHLTLYQLVNHLLRDIWAASGALNTARNALAGSGTQNAALAFGGYTGGSSAVTEKFSNGFGAINHEIANRII